MPKAHPVGGVGGAEMLNQGIPRFFMQLLQAAGHNPKLALYGLGLNPLGMAGGHIKNNLSHIRMTACSA
jgi:hypothetical protein